MLANPTPTPEIKKELVFDLHFIHGPRRVVGLTENGLQFIQMFPAPFDATDSQVYETALDCGLHVSFEDDELRDRIVGRPCECSKK